MNIKTITGWVFMGLAAYAIFTEANPVEFWGPLIIAIIYFNSNE